MKLATLKTGSRDGRLHIVSRDLTRCVTARDATTLQQALDSWAEIAPLLREEAHRLEAGEWLGVEDFAAEECASPLPRAYQWADGSAYVNHVELVRKARGAEMPPSFWTDPLMYQGGSDSFLGPRDPIQMGDEAWGIDFEAEIAVITDDVPMGVDADAARRHIRLILLVNDVSLRNLIPGELAKGFGFFQSKPSSAFSPVAVTPEELGAAWDGGKVHLPLIDTSQRPAVRQAQRRHRHDLRLRPADRPRRPHPPARRRHHHRLRHRLQQRRGWQSRQAGRGRRRRLFLHR